MFSKQERKFKTITNEEDARKKREEVQISLRKQKKEELILKKRKQMVEEKKIDPELMEKIQLIPKYYENLKNGTVQDCLDATIQIRKLLSTDSSPPIDEIIKQGIVPLLSNLLDKYEYPQLQFEAAWALTNVASGNSLQTNEVVKSGVLNKFIQLLQSNNSEIIDQAVWGIGNIAGDSINFRDYVLQLGVIPSLIKLINSDLKISILRNITWTISNLCRGKPQPDFKLIEPSIDPLSQLLYHKDEEVVADCCWAISYISDGPNEIIERVIKSKCVSRLVELLSSNNSCLQSPALKSIGNIVTSTDSHTQIVIDAGALTKFLPLLQHPRRNIRKEACWALSNITAGTPEQIQSVIDENLITPLIKLLELDEFEIKKEAAWAISNATSGGSIDQIKFLVEKSCIKPLCDLLDVKDVQIINMVLEALTNILSAGEKENPEPNEGNIYCEYVEEAGGIDKLEKLQNHESAEIYQKILIILERFFGADEIEETDAPSDYNFGEFPLPPDGFKFQ